MGLIVGNVSLSRGGRPKDFVPGDRAELTIRGPAPEQGGMGIMVRADFDYTIAAGASFEEATADARARAKALFQQCADLL
jgi:hypothetical protein